MGVITGEGHSGYERLLPDGGDPCFYCHKPITFVPCVVWIGVSTIYLHPACAEELAVRLAYDGVAARVSIANRQAFKAAIG